MDPQVSIGAFHQASWPGAGDVDDCWAVADLQAVHAVAPWLLLPGVPAYRTAAGNPDMPGPTGGTIADSQRAIRRLYPAIAALSAFWGEGDGKTFDGLVLSLRQGRVASLALLSGALPPALRHGFAGVHRVAVFWSGGPRILNPLAAAHSRPEAITASALQAACRAYDSTDIRAVLLPSPAQAFATHPLLPAAITAATQTLRDKIAAAQAALG